MYTDAWEVPHTPGPQPAWQESDCYWFYDARQGVGGFHRIGQSPHRGVGQTILFAFDRFGERFRQVRDHHTGPGSRFAAGQEVGSSRTDYLGEARVRYRWTEPDCAGDLTFAEPFYTPRDWSRRGHGGAVLKDLNADGHLECSGRLTGDLRIGARRYTIDALAHRDRSWGPRDHGVLGHHRMISGTVGPAFSIASFTFAPRGGGRMSSGFVVRDGREDDIVDLGVAALVEADGLTVRGAQIAATLESGEIVRFAASGVQGFLTPVEDICYSSDTISTMTLPEGAGFLDIEMSFNPARPGSPPAARDLIGIAIEEGLSPVKGPGA
jgi:hypothetical protein